jgi:hypothetical protein
MNRRFKLILIAAPIFALSAIAPAQNVSDAQEQPITQSLNNNVAANASATNALNAAQQEQYAHDRAAFRAEVASRRAKIEMDDAAYARQQDAYASAMLAWRIQNDECKRGILKSCKKPTPVPADYYTP